jgi:hypothetical protein
MQTDICRRFSHLIEGLTGLWRADFLAVHYTPLIWRLQAPDQGSTLDYFLFPRLKNIMKGARFADVAIIQERVTAILRSIPKEAFADSFQKLYERCRQCVVKDGNFFEGQLS